MIKSTAVLCGNVIPSYSLKLMNFETWMSTRAVDTVSVISLLRDILNMGSTVEHRKVIVLKIQKMISWGHLSQTWELK